MRTNNHQIVDYDVVLDAKFGKEGTPQRIQAEEDAYNFYTGQILLDARKEAKVTQSELAKRINSTKSYISRIENGDITPSVGVFYRIIDALGLRIDIVRPIM
ncbi:helix-turn-helix transcriptional regulator [Bacteroides helcogenes]|uniref:Helix-turn-helix domain protein n=1 Tax=Bacteroides helcogenes (strain ATCC 35417 / DSM 20613 / JCM 6297 / CCUG 15421 / P 36-108) TaxID=693979 RepID=E6SUC2_BACT6|nr:helix-turn-helix transcriptional regulator [Bacteroides helcogenes]ADV42340.1 helix-turn-helix domain protein [Bacteroides helcogenes P 36-108]MDY5237204.1 helix-turn-helix transcriptional regulator [Bacteroides helcogenes]